MLGQALADPRPTNWHSRLGHQEQPDRKDKRLVVLFRPSTEDRSCTEAGGEGTICSCIPASQTQTSKGRQGDSTEARRHRGRRRQVEAQEEAKPSHVPRTIAGPHNPGRSSCLAWMTKCCPN